MKHLGISVFIGMGQTLDENASYMELARRHGFDRLFTSLHIPEADLQAFSREGAELLQLARKLGYEVTADISPRTWQYLNLRPEGLHAFGISVLRVDWGFSTLQMCELISRSGLILEVNASTIDEEMLDELFSVGLDSKVIRAGHNYYPRPETGLSYRTFCQRSRRIAGMGISVSAFIPGKTCRRGPIFSGLPTLEEHRHMIPEEAARQIWASGCANAIAFGDPLASEGELASVASLPQSIPEILELRAWNVCPPEYGSSVLREPVHTNRMDASDYVVRSQESRQRHPGVIMPQENPLMRHRGDITVDNSRYGRYAGEMQIVLRDLPADDRVNVIGKILDQDLCLLDCLEPGRKFCLKESFH